MLLVAPAGFAQPANDNFANAVAVGGRGFTIIATNAGATTEAGETFPFPSGNANAASVWYAWTAPFDSPVSVETRGSNFDTRLRVYTGNDINALTLVASNDDVAFPADPQSATTFNATSGVTYSIAVDGFNTATGTIFLRLNATILQVSTLAGTANVEANTDGTGPAAAFVAPRGIARHPFTGDVYVADNSSYRIRVVTPAGVVTTFAGTAGSGAVDGPVATATFNAPIGLAFDASGNLYVADQNNHKIRKITPAGVVSTFAGSGTAGSADSTNPLTATFRFPSGVAVDSAFNVYVAEPDNHTIRKITQAGIVTTVAGFAIAPGFVDGPGLDARFNRPVAVTVDASGNLFVVDRDNHRIRKIAPDGTVTTFAGPTGAPATGTTDGLRDIARFNAPASITADAFGNLFVADQGNHTIRKITPSGLVTTIAGEPTVPGASNGTGATAHFNFPFGVAVDAAGNLIIADSNNEIIRRGVPRVDPITITAHPHDVEVVVGGTATFDVVAAGTTYQWFRTQGPGQITQLTDGGLFSGTATPRLTITGVTAEMHRDQFFVVASNGSPSPASNPARLTIAPNYMVSTLAGTAGQAGSTDATGSAARFSSPRSTTLDAAGNLFVADANHTIRKVTPGGVVTTLAGTAGQSGGEDGQGPAARFFQPAGLTSDAAGNLYVADTTNHTIRKVTPTGIVTTIAGSAGQPGSNDGSGTAARFLYPEDVVLDAAGNLFVSDSNNNTIRKITPAGEVTTFAGSPGAGGYVDGLGTAARFSAPLGLAIDAAGNLYVTDFSNDAVRMITPAGVVSTRVQNASSFGLLRDLAVDAAGNLYLTDESKHVIHKLTPAGVVTTIAGTGSAGSADGPGTAASFSIPRGVVVDAAGNLYVADTTNSTIRKVTPLITPLTIATQPANTTVTAGYTATFTVVAPGTTFAWSRSTDGGTTWTPLRNDATFSGTTTPQLTIAASATATAMNGHRFRINVGNGGVATAIDSASATLTVEPAYQVITFAGEVGVAGTNDGTGNAAQFKNPIGMTLDPLGNLFVTDTSNTIRRITPAGVVTTVAGVPGIYGVTPGVLFNYPAGIATDSAGNVYFADSGRHVIRKLSPNGGVTIFAGTEDSAGHIDAPGTAAKFDDPFGLTIDTAGNLFVAEVNSHTIRKITPAGVVTTVAGDAFVSGYVDATGTAALFTNPSGIAVDAPGNLYVADYGNRIIRKITPAGAVSTLAGGVRIAGSADGAGSAARFNRPFMLKVDAAGNLFVADAPESLSSGLGNTIRKITPEGVVTTIAGAAGVSGSTDGLSTVARLNNPQDVAVDAAGNLYIADANNRVVRKAVPLASSLTIAAQPVDTAVSAGYAATFAVVAPGTTFQWQRSINGGTTWTDVANGGAYSGTTTPQLSITATTTMSGEQFRVVVGNGGVATPVTSTARTLTVGPAYVVSTIAGTGSPGIVNGTGTTASFSSPADVAVDATGTIFVADYGNNAIRKITSAGAVTTYFVSGIGNIRPYSLDLDSAGNLFIAEPDNNLIRKLTPGLLATIAAGTGTAGNADVASVPTSASFRSPAGIVLDSAGNYVVVDTNNSTLRRVTTAGAVTTLAGTALATGTADGTGAAARFHHPIGVALDAGGNAYVADTENQTIRKVTPAGVVTTIAGAADLPGVVDGTGTAARFFTPTGLAIDSAGNLYVGDTFNHTIRQITPAGLVLTLAGQPGATGTTDGTGALARFNNPSGLTVDAAGVLTIADRFNHSIRKATPVYDAPAIRGNLNVAGTALVDFNYTIIANSNPASYSATGLPAGLILNATTGVISGRPTSGGTYVVTLGATNANGSASATLTITVAPGSRLLNLSTRGLAQTGDNVLIPGFVISGTGTKKLLIRAVGPTLGKAPFNVAGVLADPSMRLLKRNTGTGAFEEIAANDNWGTNTNATAITQTAAALFAFPFGDDREAALLMDLAPGEYTAISGGVNNLTGIALVELYDADAPNPGATLINISNRGFAGVGDQVMIPGFVISPESPRTVLLRVVGPRLAADPFNVPGTMVDPKLEVFPGGASTPILTNDNWGDDPNAATTAQVAAQVFAFPLTAGSKDAAMVVTLQPGSYTVVGSSATAGGTGVVLVEVYVVP